MPKGGLTSQPAMYEQATASPGLLPPAQSAFPRHKHMFIFWITKTDRLQLIAFLKEIR